MANNTARNLEPSEFTGAMNGHLAEIDGARLDSLRRLAAFRRRDTVLLRRQQSALRRDLAADDPRLLILENRIRTARRVGASSFAQVRASDLVGRVQAGERAVLGQVTDRRGRPADGLRVALSNGQATSALEEVLTDGDGFFLFQVPAAEFDSFFLATGTLVLTVLGGDGSVLHTEERPIAEGGNPVLRIDIVLPSLSGAPPAAGPSAPNGSLASAAVAEDPEVPLARIPGIGPRRQRLLQDAGITSAAQVVALEPSHLASILSVTQTQAATLIESARQLL